MIEKQAKGDCDIVALIVHFFGPQSDGDVLRRYQLMVNDDLRQHKMRGGVWTREWAEQHGPLKQLPYLLPILGRLAKDGLIKFNNGNKDRILPKGPMFQTCLVDRWKLTDIQEIEQQ